MREFDKNQKVAIIALGCVAIFVFFGAFWQLHNRLVSPFNTGTAEKNKKISFGCQGGNCQNDISALMTRQDIATASGTPIASGNLDVPDRLKASAASSSLSLSLGSSTDPVQEAELQNLLSGQGSAASIRALMLQSGADANMLKQVSDADLIQIYQESLNQDSASATTAGASIVSTSTPK
ncbi:MAG: hypothetical protein NT165_00780 [Candidatus Falkowbacteria bacterium]|nr:hypothetical protein [Candidatus Falkowbacteria bacterium]